MRSRYKKQKITIGLSQCCRVQEELQDEMIVATCSLTHVEMLFDEC